MIADIVHGWPRRVAIAATVIITSGVLAAPATGAKAAPETRTSAPIGVTGARPGSVSDWSGDGFADILAVSTTGNLYYYPNNGLQLGAAVQIGSGFHVFKHLKAADFSGDGQADVIGINQAGDLLYYPKNGTQLTGPVKLPGNFAGAEHLMVADWTCDGHADILVVFDGFLSYYPNNNNWIDGEYSIPSYSQNWTSEHVVAADWSGDGCADLIDQSFYGQASAYEIVYWPHNGAGLTAGQHLAWGGPDKFMRSMDFSGDGHADLIRVIDNGDLYYGANNGGQVTVSYRIGVGFGVFKHIL